MKTVDIIARRTPEWRELEDEISWFRHHGVQDAARVAAFAQRYRAVCGDLSLAISMRFPANTTEYLHQLVADAHTQLYRAETFRLRRWGRKILVEVPQRIVRDPCTWISFGVFWGLFFGSLIAAYSNEEFATAVVGEQTLQRVETMYAQPLENNDEDGERSAMTGFYVFNNAGIGLRCFASGIFLGVGSLITLAFNALFLGTLFGHMIRSPSADNFITFVTAHGPFELTAVVLSAAAGLRLGWGLIDTGGKSRRDSLRATSPQALEVAGVATVLFLLAAYIEGFISPSSLPYSLKVAAAAISTLLLLGYLFGLGYLVSWRRARAT